MTENTTAWDNVLLARHKNRPKAQYYIREIFQDFIELHGDRAFGDDKAVIGGLARIKDSNITLAAITKGENTYENIERNFGMSHPEGYRKILRLLKQAEKFNRTVILLIDTPGAFCGVGAEERGQGHAIAQGLIGLVNLKVPVISIVTGEGGSGGALALSLGDKVAMLENSVYSILSPEGFASIIWKDASKAKEAAEIMKLTAKDLKTFNIIDDIIGEPKGGAHVNPKEAALSLKNYIINSLEELKSCSPEYLLKKRYDKYRYIDRLWLDKTPFM